MNLYIANWEAPVVFHSFGTNLIKLGFSVKKSRIKNLPNGNIMEMLAQRANQIVIVGVSIEKKFVGLAFALHGDNKCRSFKAFDNMAQASLFFEEQLKLMEEWK